MLLIAVLLVVGLAVLAHYTDAVALGWMSEQWLAEQRHARSV